MPVTSRLTPDFSYDERALRYRDISTGRFVAQREIVGALNRVIDAGEANISGLTQSLIDGRISVGEWQAGMAGQIKTLHVAASAAAQGGWAQMSPGDWGKAGSLIKKQYQYLDNFARQIADGTQPLNGRAMQRAKLYAQAARASYQEIVRRNHYLRGYTRERRVLSGAEHCHGCIEQAARGWQPIGTLDPIGAEECRTNCLCHFEYRLGE